MTEQSTPKIENLDQKEAEERTPEAAEAAPGGRITNVRRLEQLERDHADLRSQFLRERRAPPSRRPGRRLLAPPPPPARDASCPGRGTFP